MSLGEADWCCRPPNGPPVRTCADWRAPKQVWESHSKEHTYSKCNCASLLRGGFPGGGDIARAGRPQRGASEALATPRPHSHAAHVCIYFKVCTQMCGFQGRKQRRSCRVAAAALGTRGLLGACPDGGARGLRARHTPRGPCPGRACTGGLPASPALPGAAGRLVAGWRSQGSLGCSVPAPRVHVFLLPVDPVQQLRGTCLVFHRPSRHLLGIFPGTKARLASQTPSRSWDPLLLFLSEFRFWSPLGMRAFSRGAHVCTPSRLSVAGSTTNKSHPLCSPPRPFGGFGL